ncbi:MAG: ATP-binding protein [Coriobacteriales bacterium]
MERIPLSAFREAIANALAHRTWDVPASITVAMHHDRVVVTSPGSLPPGVQEKSYLAGGLSIPRNPILANVLFRLGYIELFGSGIPQIKNAYAECTVQPSFKILDASIRVTLPTIDAMPALTPEEKTVLDALPEKMLLSRAQLEESTGMSRSSVIRALSALEDKGLVERTGRARGTRYLRR